MPKTAMYKHHIIENEDAGYVGAFEFPENSFYDGRYYYPCGYVSLQNDSHMKFNTMVADHMGNIGQPGLGTFNDMGTVQYTYNANSSLTGMTRYGRKDIGYGVIDNLTYSYNDNQLNVISDAIANQHYEGDFEFRNNTVSAPSGTPEYGYDGCGSMTYDPNRSIYVVKKIIETLNK